jgi:catechol 2,3-dioxygenase-like lactoylglutathione lyase family enzyme
MPVRYAHTNIIAADWQRLAEFYQRVFGCEFVPPERNQSGPWLADGTGVPGAALCGVHLRLPGHGPTGPTLEIYSYSQMEEKLSALPNRKGLGHLAFALDDVKATLDQIIACGGRAIGQIVSVQVPGAGAVTFTYAVDPEDNLIELQKWS